MFETLERHYEQAIWYGVFFAAGFAFGFVMSWLLLSTQQLNSLLAYGIMWGAGGVFSTFIMIEFGHHLAKRR